jgi:uncharacterized protein (DUF885 family)
MAAEAPPADAKLEACFRQYLEGLFQLRPLEATRLGDHRFDRQLEDLSAAARAGWTRYTRQTLEELTRRVDCVGLSAAGKVDFEIFRHELLRSLWLDANTRPFEEDPRIYNTYVNDCVYLPLTQSTLPKETNLASAVARMRQIPKLLAAARQNLQNPPRVVVQTAIAQNRGAIGFFQHDIFELAGPAPQEEEALRAAAAAVAKALQQHQDFLEHDLLPRARGQWRLGPERFAQKLDLELDADLTAEQVLSAAEEEFARLEQELYVIARQKWFRDCAGKPFPPDDAEGRRATVRAVLQAVGRVHGRPDELARDVCATVERVKLFIRQHDILRLPEPDRCRLIEMPEFQRGNSTAFLNPAPPLDPQAPSIYAVSPPPKEWDTARVESFLEEYNHCLLQILTIHEAYPGHYVQLEYANRVPSLVRRVLGSGVYMEGWAVYMEQTMLDEGYGDGDLALRLTQLKFRLRAVGNAILDHKMHCCGMTDDEALAFLTGRAFQSEGEARLKIIRAKQSSCQLSTYFVGRTAMMRLRAAIQRELGPKFRLARFHEAVLQQGSVPVKYLPALVRVELGL